MAALADPIWNGIWTGLNTASSKKHQEALDLADQTYKQHQQAFQEAYQTKNQSLEEQRAGMEKDAQTQRVAAFKYQQQQDAQDRTDKLAEAKTKSDETAAKMLETAKYHKDLTDIKGKALENALSKGDTQSGLAILRMIQQDEIQGGLPPEQAYDLVSHMAEKYGLHPGKLGDAVGQPAGKGNTPAPNAALSQEQPQFTPHGAMPKQPLTPQSTDATGKTPPRAFMDVLPMVAKTMAQKAAKVKEAQVKADAAQAINDANKTIKQNEAKISTMKAGAYKQETDLRIAHMGNVLQKDAADLTRTRAETAKIGADIQRIGLEEQKIKQGIAKGYNIGSDKDYHKTFTEAHSHLATLHNDMSKSQTALYNAQKTLGTILQSAKMAEANGGTLTQGKDTYTTDQLMSQITPLTKRVKALKDGLEDVTKNYSTYKSYTEQVDAYGKSHGLYQETKPTGKPVPAGNRANQLMNLGVSPEQLKKEAGLKNVVPIHSPEYYQRNQKPAPKDGTKKSAKQKSDDELWNTLRGK